LPHATLLWPVLALTLNACIWGVSWWPFRYLQQAGLHPLWATALIYAMASLLIAARHPKALAQLWRAKPLWLVLLASGCTNASFNWGVTVGDVVRVVLLFNLTPIWAVLLARLLLREPLTGSAAGRVGLAVLGAALVLWPHDGRSLLPSMTDTLGLLGGFTFALNNVLLRREAHQGAAPTALAMFLGGSVVAGALALALQGAAAVPLPPALALGWVLPALLLCALFVMGNLALQYGAARLPAQVTGVVVVTEIVFAAGSAALLGAGLLTAPLLLGGALILAATLWSVRA
jgi:drug/metabolite transporter (DMT)-like permease